MRISRALLAAAVAATAGAFAGQEQTDLPGPAGDRTLIDKADPTTDGTFEGTWLYVNRDARFAMWSRMKNGSPQVKVQYQSLASPEAFESDWDGKALYFLGGNPVTFELKLAPSTSDKIVGRWFWELKVGDARRRETADVVLYRTHYGRTMLMDFQNFEKTVTKGGVDKTAKLPVVWTWIKISKRELIWDELPF